MAKRITGDMNLLEVLRKYPGTRKVIDRNGMGCRGCMGAAAETVRQSALTHGIESYVSLAATPLTDIHAIHAIKLISKNLRQADERFRVLAGTQDQKPARSEYPDTA